MNPGVQANIMAIVWIILVATGWGQKTLEDGRLTPRLTVSFLVLFLFVTLSGLTVSAGHRVEVEVGGLLLPAAAWLWSLWAYRDASYQFQWFLGMVTVAASMTILMTLVPMDPAFFLVEVEYLYPLSVIIIAVMSVRRPFFAVSIALAGMAVAYALDPFLHGRFGAEDVVIGGGDMRDTLLYTAFGVLVTHGLYHKTAGYLKERVKNLFGGRSQQQEGGPEHV